MAIASPPMGFNNWARFECNLNQSLFTSTADAMVANGLLAAGYNRLNIDDCWMTHQRAANGSLQWNSTLFPAGLPWLSDYLHARGFHFGIYEDAGNETCGGYPGSLGFEETDAHTFVSWGIDYLKLDGCNVPSQKPGGDVDEHVYRDIYGHWHAVLANMTPTLTFSESAPAYFSDEPNLTDWYTVMDWVPAFGQLARHSADIATYASGDDPWASLLSNYGEQSLVARYQRPGYFNDPDFLIPDAPGLSLVERRSQFALWCSLSAPLIISAYIPGLPPDDIAYLTNADLIAVDQDPLGLQATLVSQDGTWDVLSKSLHGGDRLLTVLNRGNSSASHYSVSLARLGLKPKAGCALQARDLWHGRSLPLSGDSIRIDNIPAHGTAVFRIFSSTPGCTDAVPTGMIFNTASHTCLKGGQMNSSSVALAPCDAADAQVWQVGSDGRVRSLASNASCLTEGSHGTLAMARCSGAASQQWEYHQSGNLVNVASGQCLTETHGGAVATGPCLSEANGQVFGLPSGVELKG